jgi:antitoxin MazE6
MNTKTAISVPSDVFKLSERLAKKLKISRSAVFALGVKKLGEEYDDSGITERLNEFYGNQKAELDPVIVQMAALSLPKEEW